MRDYGKVHTSFWTSANIRGLSEDGRALAMYLLTCPHGTIAGVFRLPDGYACEDMQWEPERVSKGFSELLTNGFANRCETTKWVWIVKHFEWNLPENPNQRKSVAKVARQVPDECGWKQAFMLACSKVAGNELGQGANHCETVTEPFLNQEQEQEQETTTSSAPADLLACPVEELIDLYHAHMPLNPRCRVLNETRKRSIRQRWREASRLDCKPFGYATTDEGLDAWGVFFSVCAESDFLTGKTPGRNGAPPFIADVDFLFSPSGFAKCLENKYHREAA